MKEWKTEELGGLVKAGGGRIQTGPFGSQLHAADYVAEGIPCIMPTNMENNRVRLDGIARITETDAQRLKRHIVKTGDIVYSRRGDVTQKALIHPTEDGYFCGTGCLLLRPGDKIDPTFLTYYLSTKTYQNWIVSQAVGGTMPNLNTGILERVSFTAPDKDTQQKIAKVLATLDAKIALNNRINTELEAMAKLLYDYWFVQFDFPMTAAQAAALGQAQLEGQPYKSSGGKMVFNSTLKREIPEGWEVKELAEVEDKIVTGKTPSTKDRDNFVGEIPFICIGDVRGNMHVVETELTLSAKGANLQKNKFIPEGAICVTCIASPGLVAFATEDSQTNQQLNSIVCKSRENKNYLYFYLKDYFRHAKGAKTGNTFANMNKGDFSAITVLCPKKDSLQRFHELTDGAINSVLNNQKQNLELTTLRDWLLPMLMNGQVTVQD